MPAWVVPARFFGLLGGSTGRQAGEVRVYNMFKELAILPADHLHLPEDDEVSARPLKWNPPVIQGWSDTKGGSSCAPIKATGKSSPLFAGSVG